MVNRTKPKKIDDSFDFGALLEAIAWHVNSTFDGEFIKMTRGDAIRIIHKHGDYHNEMVYNKKTKTWVCSCGENLFIPGGNNG